MQSPELSYTSNFLAAYLPNHLGDRQLKMTRRYECLQDSEEKEGSDNDLHRACCCGEYASNPLLIGGHFHTLSVSLGSLLKTVYLLKIEPPRGLS